MMGETVKLNEEVLTKEQFEAKKKQLKAMKIKLKEVSPGIYKTLLHG